MIRLAPVPGRRTMAAILALVAAAALSAPVQAAAPDDDVLRLVPDDVGFCLVVRDLRGHMARLAESPFAQRFRTSALGRRLLAAPEWAKLAAADSSLQTYLKITWAELRDDILGDLLVMAYRPGPPGRPEQEQGLLLLRARDERRLADLVERANAVQRQAGDLKQLDERRYHGKTYFHRVDKKGENYYYLHGPVLVFATREAILQQVLDLEGKSLSAGESRVVSELHRLGADQVLAALWVNPRAFDADLEARAGRGQGGEAVFLRTLLAYWKALDGIVFAAAMEHDAFDLRLTLAVKPDATLPGGRRLFATPPRASDLWARFGEHTLLALAGQVDAAGLSNFVGDFLTADVRKAVRDSANVRVGAVLDQDLSRDVLPALGPDWGFAVFAPPADKGWFPQMLWALRVRPGRGKQPVEQSLLGALDSLARAAVLGFNLEHADAPMRLHVVEQDRVKIKYLANDKLFPPGFQPAFAYKDGYLVLASSPDAIRRLGPARTPAAPGEAVPLIRASLRGWRDYLKERRRELAEYLVREKQIPHEEADRRLGNLIDGLELLEGFDLSERWVRPGQLTLGLRLRPAAPLTPSR